MESISRKNISFIISSSTPSPPSSYSSSCNYSQTLFNSFSPNEMLSFQTVATQSENKDEKKIYNHVMDHVPEHLIIIRIDTITHIHDKHIHKRIRNRH